MLEFLRECDENNIYSYAMDVEINLKSFNSILMMHVFFEKTFKSILVNELGASPIVIDRKKLIELINDEDLKAFLVGKLKFYDIEKVDELIRKYGNCGKHSLNYQKPNDDETRDLFEIVFDFSKAFYSYKTGKTSPKWSIDAYNELYNSCVSGIDKEEKTKLENEYNELFDEVKCKDKEIKHYKKELLKLEKKIKDKDCNIALQNSKIEEYTNKIDALEKEKERLQISKDELEEKIYVSSKETDKQFKMYESLKYWSEKKQYEFPRCPFCQTILKIRTNSKNGSKFLSCPNWKSDRTGCNYTKSLNPEEEKKLSTIDAKISEFYNKKTEIDNKTQKKIIEFNYFETTNDYNNPSYYFFNTLLTTKSIIEAKNKDALGSYAKFYFATNISPQKVDAKERLIYSLVLRILNRGIVVPASKNIEKEFREVFNKNKTGDLTCLHDLFTYRNPFFPYDSEIEKRFAQTYFPMKLGKSWASNVMAQVGFDFIAPEMSNDEKMSLSNQRVDFFFANNENKIVIEIDGEEHNFNRQKDQFRDRILKKYDVETIRITNAEVLSNSDTVLNKLSLIKMTDDYDDINCDEKMLFSLKIYNQIQIVLIKMLEKGYINLHSNLEIFGLDDVFSSTEKYFIYSKAINDLKEMISVLSNIYEMKLDLSFNDKNIEKTTLYFGDGKLEGNSIIVRDCYPGHNYLCELEEFPQDYYPSNIEESDLEYFLSYIFGYDKFREGQFEAIKRLLLKIDSIILLPTGAGKSIIYQLASYLVPGIIFVVSPLVSLIEDQTFNLQSKFGITNAVPLFSSKTEEDKINNNRKLKIMKNNITSLLYLSPERLQIPSFRDNLADLKLRNNIYAVAIDEAHCVSEWGHDFRAAYLNIAKVARDILAKDGYVPTIIALTGTASDAVLSDVKRDLDINGDDSIVRPTSFDRSELSFSIYKCGCASKSHLIASLIRNVIPEKLNIDYSDFVKRNNGSDTKLGIVFTQTAIGKRNANVSALKLKRDLSYLLPELGINVYFSKNPTEYTEVAWNQFLHSTVESFKNNDLNLLVATKAFGMGIDKENIRYTIHAGIPSSFEQFYQEAGRAGRDRKKSECILIFSDDNHQLNEEILNPSLTFDDLQKAYENYVKAANEDDLNSILFFHNDSFEGVENEIEYIVDIVNELKTKNVEANTEIKIYRKDKEQSPKILHAIVRLVILGVIKDYTYDYLGTYCITIGSIEKESIIDKYEYYVSGYNVGRVESERNKIAELKTIGWDLVIEAARILIFYVYDNIEQSRRQAIRTMYNMAREASLIDVNKQDKFIRDRILSYFMIKDDNKSILDEIIDSTTAGFDILEKYINLKREEFVFTKQQKNRANSLLMPIQRRLESKPDHPGLLYLLAINQLINYKHDSNMDICNNIIAAYNYSFSRYSVELDVANEKLYQICNLTLNISYKVFDNLVDQLQRNNVDLLKVYKGILKTVPLSKKNMEYVLLKYANEKLKELEC